MAAMLTQAHGMCLHISSLSTGAMPVPIGHEHSIQVFSGVTKNPNKWVAKYLPKTVPSLRFMYEGVGEGVLSCSRLSLVAQGVEL